MNANAYENDRALGVPQDTRAISRKISLAGGILYLLTFVSMPIGLLYYAILNDPNYIVGSGPDTPVVIGGILEIIVALAGIGLASFIWLKRREIADTAAATFPGLYRLLLHKYYVDEIYDVTVVEPIRIVSQEGLWRGIDVNVIDGAVNGTASIVDGGSSLLRRLQSGSVLAYAGSLFVGVVLILGYYLWR